MFFLPHVGPVMQRIQKKVTRDHCFRIKNFFFNNYNVCQTVPLLVSQTVDPSFYSFMTWRQQQDLEKMSCVGRIIATELK